MTTSRLRGDVAFALALEQTISRPIDARAVTPLFAHLTEGGSGSKELEYVYVGMLVGVTNDPDPSKNGLYQLTGPERSLPTSWKNISTAAIKSQIVNIGDVNTDEIIEQAGVSITQQAPLLQIQTEKINILGDFNTNVPSLQRSICSSYRNGIETTNSVPTPVVNVTDDLNDFMEASPFVAFCHARVVAFTSFDDTTAFEFTFLVKGSVGTYEIKSGSFLSFGDAQGSINAYPMQDGIGIMVVGDHIRQTRFTCTLTLELNS